MVTEKEIITMISKGMKCKEIADKFYINEKTVRCILKENNFRYDNKLKRWINENNKDEKFLCEVDKRVSIVHEIAKLSAPRYYDRFVKVYDGSVDENRAEIIEINRDIKGELEEMKDRFGANTTEQLMELILLRFLDANNKKDSTEEFKEKYFKEIGQHRDIKKSLKDMRYVVIECLEPLKIKTVNSDYIMSEHMEGGCNNCR